MMLALSLATLSVDEVAAQSDTTNGQIEGDVPIEVLKSQPFDFYVWVKPRNREFDGTVKVFMDNNPKVKYEPSEFMLKVGERRQVRATIIATNCGLAVIGAHADNWHDLDITVNAGFSAKLKANLADPVESGDQKSFSISLIDKDSKPVQLDVEARLIIQASKILLRDQTNNRWVEKVEVKLPLGTSSTAVDIRPNTWSSDTGMITAELRSYRDFPVHSESFYLPILPPWYVPLLMAMLGGLLYSTTQILKKFSRRKATGFRFLLNKVLPGLLPGLVAGTIAYLLASWGILGIKVDTTSLKGFVILGFLFSYVGVDLVLRAATQRKDAT
jgi:hypothetical protein